MQIAPDMNGNSKHVLIRSKSQKSPFLGGGLLKTFQKSQQNVELYLNYRHYNKCVKNINKYKRHKGHKRSTKIKLLTSPQMARVLENRK